MGTTRRILLAFLLVTSTAALGEGVWNAGIREGGGGFYISAPDQSYHLNFLGYGQFLASVLSDEYRRGADRADSPFGFGVRRARFSALATVHRNFEFLLEMGTPTLRPFPGTAALPGGATLPAGLTGATTTSDFGVVEARLTAGLFGEWLQLRAGKFIGPFSLENSRSPRNLDMIERGTVLNSMHSISALDTQIGLMFFGRVLDGVLNYYLAAFNGNSESNTSGGDNNSDKEFQLKFVFQPHRSVTFGFGWDYDRLASPRLLSVVDHAFVPFVSGVVQGTRHGVEADFDLAIDWFSLRFEGMYFTFPDSTAASSLRFLYGAYLQLGFMVAGNQNHGLQILGRYDGALAQVGSTHTLHSVLLGFNIFINSNVVNRINYAAELPSTQNGAGTYAIQGVKHVLLNELQVKF